SDPGAAGSDSASRAPRALRRRAQRRCRRQSSRSSGRTLSPRLTALFFARLFEPPLQGNDWSAEEPSHSNGRDIPALRRGVGRIPPEAKIPPACLWDGECFGLLVSTHFWTPSVFQNRRIPSRLRLSF